MKYGLTITLVILTTMVVDTTAAQVAPTPQAVLERTKTDSLTKDNYRQTLQSLHVTLPVYLCRQMIQHARKIQFQELMAVGIQMRRVVT